MAQRAVAAFLLPTAMACVFPNYCSDRTSARPPVRPHHRHTNVEIESFSTLFLMFTLTLITQKELEHVIENKGDEFPWKKNMKIS